MEKGLGALTDRFVKGSTGGPDAAERARSGSHIVGEAFDAGGTRLAEAHLTGVDGYTFTGEVLAWGAERAANGGLKGAGALGPVDGLRPDALEVGVARGGHPKNLTRPAQGLGPTADLTHMDPFGRDERALMGRTAGVLWALASIVALLGQLLPGPDSQHPWVVLALCAVGLAYGAACFTGLVPWETMSLRQHVIGCLALYPLCG